MNASPFPAPRRALPPPTNLRLRCATLVAAVLAWSLAAPAAAQRPSGGEPAGAVAPARRTGNARVTRGGTSHALTVAGGHFLLDGKPFQILSGEMHYARVPRAYWRDRFRKARAMGLNTISTYVFWNLHEPRPGVYDFSGQNDVAEYVREAGEEGLHVILRPGPYVCAEWELGGYPAWLLADSGVVLRSTDPRFTAPAERWLRRLGRELVPLLSTRGGPIVAVQVENEYGSFDGDTAYMRWSVNALRRAGLGGALLYTADGPEQLPRGTLPDLPAVVNFGPGDADSAFAKLVAFRPGQAPAALMAGEYWAGWFDSWGQPHHATDPAREARELEWMVGRGYSVNLYMFHGGSTRGFMNGANGSPGRGDYAPQTSSYDYDAALDESGRPTRKYELFRQILAHRSATPLPPVPATPAAIAIPTFPVDQVLALESMLPAAIRAERPRSMEAVGQSYGYILYRAKVSGPLQGDLVLRRMRDYARVAVDGKLAGTLDRRLRQDRLPLSLAAGSHTLDILVENGGRINFTKALRTERKGLDGAVTLAGRELTGWRIYTLPLTAPLQLPRRGFLRAKPTGPAFYRASFAVAHPGDTFLDLRGWGKGAVWVNGHALGRFWSVGPQQTLYVPGPWLRAGANEVVVFDLDVPSKRTLAGLTRPILDDVPH